MSPSWSWPWHFVSVSEFEKKQRRVLLDLRGYIAQCSVLVVILAIRVYRSYYAKHAGNGVRQPWPRGRQQSWWDQALFSRGTETRRQYVVCSLWLGWLLGLSAWRTGDDYLHFTKALGQVGLSQLPLQVLFAPGSYFSSFKPVSPSILSFLTSIAQPFLTPYHRLFGRIVFTPLILGHILLYLVFFVQSASPNPAFGSLLAKRIWDADVQWGITAVSVAATVLFVLTRPLGQQRGQGLSSVVWHFSLGSDLGSPMKDQRWRFYVAHVLLVGVFCLAVYVHVGQAKPFVLETVGSYAVSLCL